MKERSSSLLRFSTNIDPCVPRIWILLLLLVLVLAPSATLNLPFPEIKQSRRAGTDSERSSALGETHQVNITSSNPEIASYFHGNGSANNSNNNEQQTKVPFQANSIKNAKASGKEHTESIVSVSSSLDNKEDHRQLSSGNLHVNSSQDGNLSHHHPFSGRHHDNSSHDHLSSGHLPGNSSHHNFSSSHFHGNLSDHHSSSGHFHGNSSHNDISSGHLHDNSSNNSTKTHHDLSLDHLHANTSKYANTTHPNLHSGHLYDSVHNKSKGSSLTSSTLHKPVINETDLLNATTTENPEKNTEQIDALMQIKIPENKQNNFLELGLEKLPKIESSRISNLHDSNVMKSVDATKAHSVKPSIATYNTDVKRKATDDKSAKLLSLEQRITAWLLQQKDDDSDLLEKATESLIDKNNNDKIFQDFGSTDFDKKNNESGNNRKERMDNAKLKSTKVVETLTQIQNYGQNISDTISDGTYSVPPNSEIKGHNHENVFLDTRQIPKFNLYDEVKKIENNKKYKNKGDTITGKDLSKDEDKLYDYYYFFDRPANFQPFFDYAEKSLTSDGAIFYDDKQKSKDILKRKEDGKLAQEAIHEVGSFHTVENFIEQNSGGHKSGIQKRKPKAGLKNNLDVEDKPETVPENKKVTERGVDVSTFQARFEPAENEDKFKIIQVTDISENIDLGDKNVSEFEMNKSRKIVTGNVEIEDKKESKESKYGQGEENIKLFIAKPPSERFFGKEESFKTADHLNDERFLDAILKEQSESDVKLNPLAQALTKPDILSFDEDKFKDYIEIDERPKNKPQKIIIPVDDMTSPVFENEFYLKESANMWKSAGEKANFLLFENHLLGDNDLSLDQPFVKHDVAMATDIIQNDKNAKLFKDILAPNLQNYDTLKNLQNIDNITNPQNDSNLANFENNFTHLKNGNNLSNMQNSDNVIDQQNGHKMKYFQNADNITDKSGYNIANETSNNMTNKKGDNLITTQTDGNFVDIQKADNSSSEIEKQNSTIVSKQEEKFSKTNQQLSDIPTSNTTQNVVISTSNTTQNVVNLASNKAQGVISEAYLAVWASALWRNSSESNTSYSSQPITLNPTEAIKVNVNNSNESANISKDVKLVENEVRNITSCDSTVFKINKGRNKIQQQNSSRDSAKIKITSSKTNDNLNNNGIFNKHNSNNYNARRNNSDINKLAPKSNIKAGRENSTSANGKSPVNMTGVSEPTGRSTTSRQVVTQNKDYTKVLNQPLNIRASVISHEHSENFMSALSRRDDETNSSALNREMSDKMLSNQGRYNSQDQVNPQGGSNFQGQPNPQGRSNFQDQFNPQGQFNPKDRSISLDQGQSDERLNNSQAMFSATVPRIDQVAYPGNLPSPKVAVSTTNDKKTPTPFRSRLDAAANSYTPIANASVLMSTTNNSSPQYNLHSRNDFFHLRQDDSKSKSNGEQNDSSNVPLSIIPTPQPIILLKDKSKTTNLTLESRNHQTESNKLSLKHLPSQPAQVSGISKTSKNISIFGNQEHILEKNFLSQNFNKSLEAENTFDRTHGKSFDSALLWPKVTNSSYHESKISKQNISEENSPFNGSNLRGELAGINNNETNERKNANVSGDDFLFGSYSNNNYSVLHFSAGTNIGRKLLSVSELKIQEQVQSKTLQEADHYVKSNGTSFTSQSVLRPPINISSFTEIPKENVTVTWKHNHNSSKSLKGSTLNITDLDISLDGQHRLKNVSTGFTRSNVIPVVSEENRKIKNVIKNATDNAYKNNNGSSLGKEGVVTNSRNLNATSTTQRSKEKSQNRSSSTVAKNLAIQPEIMANERAQQSRTQNQRIEPEFVLGGAGDLENVDRSRDSIDNDNNNSNNRQDDGNNETGSSNNEDIHVRSQESGNEDDIRKEILRRNDDLRNSITTDTSNNQRLQNNRGSNNGRDEDEDGGSINNNENIRNSDVHILGVDEIGINSDQENSNPTPLANLQKLPAEELDFLVLKTQSSGTADSADQAKLENKEGDHMQVSVGTEGRSDWTLGTETEIKDAKAKNDDILGNISKSIDTRRSEDLRHYMSAVASAKIPDMTPYRVQDFSLLKPTPDKKTTNTDKEKNKNKSTPVAAAASPSSLSENTKNVTKEQSSNASSSRTDCDGGCALGAGVTSQRPQAAVSAVLTTHFGPTKDQIIPFDLELLDLADNYDNTTGMFICTVPGTYVISLYLMSHPGAKVNARVLINNRPIAALWADDAKNAGFYPSSSTQTIAQLAFGDQVYVMLVDGGYGDSWVHANYNVFTIFLLYEQMF